jgi:small-conductance mechanosensitive channel
MLGVELWRFGSTLDTDECFGPQVARERGWFDIFRLASWVVAFTIGISVLIGYAAFGSFLLEQFFRVCAVACLLFMSIVLAEEAIGAGLAPTTRIGHRLVTSIGFNRNSLDLTGVLVSGLIRLVFFVVAAGLVLAPWGLAVERCSDRFRRRLFWLQGWRSTDFAVQHLHRHRPFRAGLWDVSCGAAMGRFQAVFAFEF